MINFIKHRIRNYLKEQMIDGQEMNQDMQSLCNTMSVSSYEEVVDLVTKAIGTRDNNPNLWKKIEMPLNNLRIANNNINKEKHTNQFNKITKIGNNMTGDSIPDEANTYWSMIQTTLCEQGPEFQ